MAAPAIVTINCIIHKTQQGSRFSITFDKKNHFCLTIEERLCLW